MANKYFNDYNKARKYAEKHKLRECEYGDTGYMHGDEPISYCAWNKSGDRNDEWEVEVYYTWERNEGSDPIPYHKLKQCPIDKEWIRQIYGIEIDN